VIVCSGTFGTTAPIIEKAEAAARAGFDGISVYAREFEPGLPRRLADLGLRVAEVDGTTSWFPGESGTSIERTIEIAAELQARSITILETQGQTLEPSLAAEHFARVCELAEPAGLDVDIEPFAWSGLATVAAAADIIRRAGHPRGGITLDVWHLVRGPEQGHLDPAHVDLVHALQVSDPAPGSPPPGLSLRDECMNHRQLPGSWSARLAAMLPGVPLEVEVFALAGTLDHVAAAAYQTLRDLTV
jgi:sugar phosphate isomerase/epimerase